MKSSDGPRISLYLLLSVLVMAVAAALRLIALDWPPLTQLEARQALVAYFSLHAEAWRALDSLVAANPLYLWLTETLFTLAGNSDGAARLASALAGVALCAIPLLAWPKLGKAFSLCLAFLLALSPLMTTIARTAGGGSLAAASWLAAGVLLVGLGGGEHAWRRYGAAAAIGLAVAAGLHFWQGLLAVALGLVLILLTARRQLALLDPLFDEFGKFGRGELAVGALAVMAGATALGFHPSGLEELFDGLGVWIAGWRNPSGVAGANLLVGLSVYEPMLLVFAGFGLVVGMHRQSRSMFIALALAGGAALAVLIYPGRTAADLIWLVFPLAYLAADGLKSAIEMLLEPESALRDLGLTLAGAGLIGFVYLETAAYTLGAAPDTGILPPSVSLMLGVIGSLALVLFLIGIAGVVWGGLQSRKLIVQLGLILLLAFDLGGIFSLNFGRRAYSAATLWSAETARPEMKQLRDTLAFTAGQFGGRPAFLPVALRGIEDPAVVWAIRDFGVPPAGPSQAGSSSPVILMPGDTPPEDLTAGYSGQQLLLTEQRGWPGILPPDFFLWLVRRDAPALPQPWMVLVRSDIASPEVPPP
jgi:hypothetical protein